MLSIRISLWGGTRGPAAGGSGPNLLTNAIWGGATSGTPGAPPTSWTANSALGTQTVAALGDGANSVRIVTSAARHFYSQSVAAQASTGYVFSFRVDVAVSAALQQVVSVANLPTGATLAYRINGTTATGATVLPVASGVLIEAVLTVATTAGTPSWRWGVGASGNTTADMTFYRPKLEIGTAATAWVAT